VFLVGLSAVGCVLATYHGADDLDYKVFMVKHALISHDAALTKSVYDICANISPAPSSSCSRPPARSSAAPVAGAPAYASARATRPG